MHRSLLFRLSARFTFLAACIGSSTTQAQTHSELIRDDNVALDQFVVSATRTPQDLASTPSSVSIVPLNDLAIEQVVTLRDALAEEPGVVVLNSGAIGSQTSILLRGANADQTLLVVDGVRMNDRSALDNNFLGGADLSGIGHMEVLRGPQSTLYGSSAMGGVILIDSARGVGSPNGTLSATAGSFNSIGGAVTLLGSSDDLSYSLWLERFVTANDRDYNGFQHWSYATRLEYNPAPNVLIGATFRGENDHYEEPGSTAFVSPGAVTLGNYLATVYGQMHVSEDLTSRLTIALHHRPYAFDYGFGVSDLRNTRKIIDWQNNWIASPQLEIVAGVNAEWSRYFVDGAETKDHLGAGYLSATAKPVSGLTIDAGVRYDDFKSVGSAVTWRTGIAWQAAKETKLRATYGTGFNAPGSDDRYGVPDFGQLPSPDLKPEKSRGWDVGIDQTLLNGDSTVSVTYFQNRFRNLFEFAYVDFVTFTGRTVNRARASTDGIEFEATDRLGKWLRVHLAYTYLDAYNDSDAVRLTRRPRHDIDVDLTYTPNSAWTVGAGLHAIADRIDGGTPLEDYTVVRAFTSYELRRNWLLKLRVENLFNEKYQEVRGYPALPLGVFASTELKY